MDKGLAVCAAHLVKIQVWAALPTKKREANSCSQHGDAIGCSLSPYCKFEINWRLFVIGGEIYHVNKNTPYSGKH